MQKRSIGLTILGWFEIVVGFLGGGFFLLCLLYFFAYVRSGGGNILMVFIVFFPPAALLSGLCFIGAEILRLKKRAWIMNVFVYPLVHIYLYIIFWILKKWNISIFGYVIEKISIIWWLALAVLIFYLLHPKIKAQFFGSHSK